MFKTSNLQHLNKVTLVKFFVISALECVVAKPIRLALTEVLKIVISIFKTSVRTYLIGFATMHPNADITKKFTIIYFLHFHGKLVISS